jgi:xanthine dehydrogenase YagT iron-sulfur-binding subunit
MNLSLRLTVNGEQREMTLDDPRVTLLDLLRERLQLTGTKKGCDRGQCGFCTPGQIMSAIGLIAEAQTGDDPERIREAMSGNLCRCGAYVGITEAVLEAQKILKDTKTERAA